MQRPRRLLEAEREQWYRQMPVPEGWHRDYAQGKVSTDQYTDQLAYRS